MDLLPKTSEDFGKTEYWNSFFKKRGNKAFEWYGEYLQLCDQLHKYIKPRDKILVVGCGNSKLSMDLYDAGFKSITNIDISQVAIAKMIDMNAKSRSDMKFMQMDATQMSFDDEEFTVVLDKGTLDALMTDDSDEVKATALKYVNEIRRVLRTGGRYICISLLQGHILEFLLEYFPKNNCMFRVTKCAGVELSDDNGSCKISMPVFVVVASKFTDLPHPILEICISGTKMHRLESTDKMMEYIFSEQKTALIRNGLIRGNIAGLGEISIELLIPESDKIRYTIYVIDVVHKSTNGEYAAFIVPQGREVEWLFSTPSGRKKLTESAQFNRLAIVTMHRDQIYDDLEAVKVELAQSIKNFAPHDLTQKIPYLSLASQVGKREKIFSGSSDISGDFLVEDVEGDQGKMFRRLIFLNNQAVVQSEALIDKSIKKGAKKKLDLNYLACDHHLFMTAGVQLCVENPETKCRDVLVIGLGGGGLCTFMNKLIKNSNITAIEIDSAMLKVAEEYFELKQDQRLKVVIDDGIKYLKRCANSSEKKYFNAVLFDVDSKDSTLGMSCPPKNFLEKETLVAVQKIIGSNGLFVLNLVCRDENLRNEVVKDLQSHFKSICCYKLEEDVNEIIFCGNFERDLDEWKKSFEICCKNLNRVSKELKFAENDMINLQEFLEYLTIT